MVVEITTKSVIMMMNKVITSVLIVITCNGIEVTSGAQKQDNTFTFAIMAAIVEVAKTLQLACDGIKVPGVAQQYNFAGWLSLILCFQS